MIPGRPSFAIHSEQLNPAHFYKDGFDTAAKSWTSRKRSPAVCTSPDSWLLCFFCVAMPCCAQNSLMHASQRLPPKTTPAGTATSFHTCWKLKEESFLNFWFGSTAPAWLRSCTTYALSSSVFSIIGLGDSEADSVGEYRCIKLKPPKRHCD